MEQDVAIRVVVQGQAPGSATVKVRALSAEQRGNRAFKAAAILAAIGMGSVFIPVVHFFLPWIMLISVHTHSWPVCRAAGGDDSMPGLQRRCGDRRTTGDLADRVELRRVSLAFAPGPGRAAMSDRRRLLRHSR